MKRAALVSVIGAAVLAACVVDPRERPTLDGGFVEDASIDAPSDATLDAPLDVHGSDGAPSDSSPGVDAPVDAGRDAPKVCAPVDMSTFVPTWHPPSGKDQALCTASEVFSLVSQCDPLQSSAVCQNIESSHGRCTACMFRNEASTSRGPMTYFAEYGVQWYPSSGGCVALLANDVTAAGCGAKVDAAFQCTHDACAAGCAPDIAKLEACASQAAQGTCKSFVDAANACVAAGGGFPACFLQTNEAASTLLERLGNLFCGTPSADAGPG